MTSGVDQLSDLSFARRARSALAASPTLAWVADGDAGIAPFYEECGSPMMLTDPESAATLLDNSAGRVEVSLHPRIGVVRLAGQFWPLVDRRAGDVLEAERRRHAECRDCPAWRFSRVVGLQVVTVAIRLPGEPDYRPVDPEDFLLAEPHPMVAVGATVAAHLNADHEVEIADLAAALLQRAPGSLIGARVGFVDASGLELAVVDGDGGQCLWVPFQRPVATPGALPDAVHQVIAGVGRG